MSDRSPNSDQTPRPSLVSDFVGDAEMAELIEFFVTELGDRVAAIHNALESGQLAQLRRLAGQIKDAAGGYGFPSVSEIAGELEAMLRTEKPTMPEVIEKVEALTALCHRAAAGIRASR